MIKYFIDKKINEIIEECEKLDKRMDIDKVIDVDCESNSIITGSKKTILKQERKWIEEKDFKMIERVRKSYLVAINKCYKIIVKAKKKTVENVKKYLEEMDHRKYELEVVMKEKQNEEKSRKRKEYEGERKEGRMKDRAVKRQRIEGLKFDDVELKLCKERKYLEVDVKEITDVCSIMLNQTNKHETLNEELYKDGCSLLKEIKVFDKIPLDYLKSFKSVYVDIIDASKLFYPCKVCKRINRINTSQISYKCKECKTTNIIEISKTTKQTKPLSKLSKLMDTTRGMIVQRLTIESYIHVSNNIEENSWFSFIAFWRSIIPFLDKDDIYNLFLTSKHFYSTIHPIKVSYTEPQRMEKLYDHLIDGFYSRIDMDLFNKMDASKKISKIRKFEWALTDVEIDKLEQRLENDKINFLKKTKEKFIEITKKTVEKNVKIAEEFDFETGNVFKIRRNEERMDELVITIVDKKMIKNLPKKIIDAMEEFNLGVKGVFEITRSKKNPDELVITVLEKRESAKIMETITGKIPKKITEGISEAVEKFNLKVKGVFEIRLDEEKEDELVVKTLVKKKVKKTSKK